MRVDNETLKQIAVASRAYPLLMKWLTELRVKELDALPYTATQNIGVAQGRVQVLTELVKMLNEAPELAAKL